MDARSFMDDYLRAFQAMALDQTADCYRTPLVINTAKTCHVLSDRAAVRRALAQMFDAMRAQKYAPSKWARLEVDQLHGRAAIVRAVVRRFDHDDRVILDSGATYVLVRGDAWQIAQLIPHSA
jgi:hypothetical protein